jgi:predicted alpha/beta superfamily hydrolase
MKSVLLALALLAAPIVARAAPVPDEGKPIVIGQSYELHSTILGGVRRINVYLPPDYAASTKTYPVLVLLDGGAAEDFHHISGIAQVTGAYGAVEETIVVGIEGVDRRHDLTSPSSDPADLKVAPTSGGAAAYRRFLVEEVKQWIAARYRVSRTALIGESLAGLFTLETYLRAPASFDDYISVSPSLWWDRSALGKEAAADLARGVSGGSFTGKRLWLAVGDEGTGYPAQQAGTDGAVAALKASGVTGWTYHPHPSEHHDTIYDPAATAAIRSLYAIRKP